MMTTSFADLAISFTHRNCQASESRSQANELAVATISKANSKFSFRFLLLIGHRGSCRSYQASKKLIKREPRAERIVTLTAKIESDFRAMSALRERQPTRSRNSELREHFMLGGHTAAKRLQLPEMQLRVMKAPEYSVPSISLQYSIPISYPEDL
jgi:hypothetical protein